MQVGSGVIPRHLCFSLSQRRDSSKGGISTTIRIKALEFTRNGARMFRVLNIRGVLPKEKLNEDYTDDMPSFWLTRSGKTIKLHDGTTLCVNGEYHMGVFIRILTEIERAGNRLHEMNKEKHDERVAKMRAARNDKKPFVPVGEVNIKI